MKRENPSIEICLGITRRTTANGKTMYQMIATLAVGSRMPEHRRQLLVSLNFWKNDSYFSWPSSAGELRLALDLVV
jgi:hypothetical protein